MIQLTTWWAPSLAPCFLFSIDTARVGFVLLASVRSAALHGCKQQRLPAEVLCGLPDHQNPSLENRPFWPQGTTTATTPASTLCCSWNEARLICRSVTCDASRSATRAESGTGRTGEPYRCRKRRRWRLAAAEVRGLGCLSSFGSWGWVCGSRDPWSRSRGGGAC